VIESLNRLTHPRSPFGNSFVERGSGLRRRKILSPPLKPHPERSRETCIAAQPSHARCTHLLRELRIPWADRCIFPCPATLIHVHTCRTRRPWTRSSDYRDCNVFLWHSERRFHCVLFRTVDGLFWREKGVCDGHERLSSVFLVVPHYQSSGAELHRAQRWAGGGGVDCGRVTGGDVGFGLHVLLCARLKGFGPPVNLTPFFVHSRRGVHLHRRRVTQ
jgi:hypothetical protein